MRRTLVLIAASVLVLTGCGTGGSSADRVGRAPGQAPEQARLAASTSVRVVAVGDIACPPGKPMTRTTCRQAKTANAAVALDPARVLALGDLQYEKGRYRGFKRSYDKSWGKLRSITSPIPGNHEYYTSGARGYYRYFAGQQPGAPGWYHQTLGDWDVYLLNSNCGEVDCVAQRTWLAAQMAADNAARPSDTCELVAFHHPRFSSGEHGSNRSMRGFWRIAYDNGADVALSGHDHDYERFAPMDRNGAVQATGMRQFVSGGGGKSLYPRESSPAGSQVFLKRFGVLELNLGTSGYSWKFRTPKLRVRDSGSADCR